MNTCGATGEVAEFEGVLTLSIDGGGYFQSRSQKGEPAEVILPKNDRRFAGFLKESPTPVVPRNVTFLGTVVRSARCEGEVRDLIRIIRVQKISGEGAK